LRVHDERTARHAEMIHFRRQDAPRPGRPETDGLT
jgi:hypothetical protein